MNPEQLRQIASYYGAPCSYEVHDTQTEDTWFIQRGQHVGSKLFDLLVVPGYSRNLKLHLRRIESLTGEELRHCGFICGRETGDGFRSAEALNYQIFTKTRCIEGGDKVAQVIDYLLSRHVYMPGMIGAEWVSLRE